MSAIDKHRPDDGAQICRNGHTIVGSIKDYPKFQKNFCEDCGAATIDKCQKCGWPIKGPLGWMAGAGPYRPPRYCGECGQAFPWTEAALVAAKEYTDELEQLSPEERGALKKTYSDLVVDTPATPVAAERFKKLIAKAGPVAGGVIKQIITTIATEAAKKGLGL